MVSQSESVFENEFEEKIFKWAKKLNDWFLMEKVSQELDLAKSTVSKYVYGLEAKGLLEKKELTEDTKIFKASEGVGIDGKRKN